MKLLVLLMVLIFNLDAAAKKSYPRDLLIYYGWLNSFNSATCAWNPECVSKEFAKYDLIVFGDGVQDPSHGDYANTQIIIPRIKELNPEVKIFGYVTVNQNYTPDFVNKAANWDVLGVSGIFLDEAGYDYGTPATNGREALNDKIDFIHSLPFAKDVFVNSWNISHVLGLDDDPSFPNASYNPNMVHSNLRDTDWYLLESFAITSSSTYEPHSQWYARGKKAKEYQRLYGINLAAVSVINNAAANGATMFEFINVSACAWALDAFGSSDAFYGASSAAVKFWSRSPLGRAGRCYSDDPAVVLTGTNIYLRYLEKGYLKIDWTIGSELATIIRY